MNKILNLYLKHKHLSPEKMVKYAEEQTDFYREFYKNYDITNYKDLPLFTKYDLINKSPYSLLSKEFKDKVFLYGETSGSSGSPTPSFFTKKEFKGFAKLSSLSPYIQEIRKETRDNKVAINGLTFGFTVAGFTFGTLLQQNGFLVAQVGSRSTIATPERMSKTIVKLTPSVISSTPLDFMSWMQIIYETNATEYYKVLEKLKYLLSTAEPCAISRQKRINKLFNIKHVNSYASVDGFISFDCPCGEKHVLDEILYIELYDKDKKLIGNTGTGRLCFTNLMRKSTPMVKYLLDDLITIKKSNCPLGFTKSVIPHGRFELSVNINNNLLGNLDFEEIIYEYGLFMDYRVNIFDSHIDILLEEYPLAKEDYDLKSLKEYFENLTNLPCNIELVKLGELTPYKKVREQKSIIKVKDNRTNSSQIIPKFL